MVNKKIDSDIKEHNGNLANYIIHLQKFAVAGLIFSDITHELNNIVGAMLGFAQIAKMTNEEKDIKKCFDVVISCSEKAKEINNNILSYLRSNPRDEGIIDINFIIQQSILLVKKGYDKKGIEIKFESKGIPIARLRVGLFQHAFLSFLLDIRRNISPGGELKVTTSFNEKQKLIEINLRNGVCDRNYKNYFNSIESFNDIFKNVYDVDDSNKEIEAGIAYWILKKEMGGDIVIDKSEEMGTGYIIKIPAS